MMINHAAVENLGLQQIINQGKWEFAFLKAKAIVDKAGNTNGYRADLVITRDNTQIIKSNGELVKSPNVGEVITVNVVNQDVPEVDHMVLGAKLVNPVVHSVYASSSLDSTFANINWSISATNLIFPNNQPNPKVGK